MIEDLVFRIENPLTDDVRSLIETHLSFASSITPPEDVHALAIDGLLADNITLFGARADGRLLAIGALRQVDSSHVELKSMHTAEALRGRGIGRAVLEHLTAVAVERGCDRISLETGLMDEMAASRAMYASAGFTPCEPFADYPGSPNSVCMTKEL